MEQSACFPLSDTSRVGEARRIAAALAETLGVDETLRGQVALVVTELANNLVRHATNGELILRSCNELETALLEIIALDRGPGMRNVTECLRDGYSTGGTSGTGLGAVQRLSPFFDIYSLPGAGTVQVARFSGTAARNAEAGEPVEIGAVCLPKPGETECGDSWHVVHYPEGRSRILIADGLGHGPLAATASQEAARVFEKSAGRSLTETLQAMHDAIRSTRGAAAAIAEVDTAGRTVRFAGVGNISGAVVTPEEVRHMVSHNGTVGHQMARLQEFSYPLPNRAVVIMNSDGLTTQWRLDKYPGLLSRHPSLTAATLYRDFSRGRDDATVVVARPAAETAAQ